MLAPRSSIYWITLQHSESLHDWNMQITKSLVQWLPRILQRNLGSKKSYSKPLPKLLFVSGLRYVLFSQFIACPWLNLQVKQSCLFSWKYPQEKKTKPWKKELSNKFLLYWPCNRKSFATKKINAWVVNEVWETAQKMFSSLISLPQQSPIKSYMHLSSLKIQSLCSCFRDLMETPKPMLIWMVTPMPKTNQIIAYKTTSLKETLGLVNIVLNNLPLKQFWKSFLRHTEALTGKIWFLHQSSALPKEL